MNFKFQPSQWLRSFERLSLRWWVVGELLRRTPAPQLKLVEVPDRFELLAVGLAERIRLLETIRGTEWELNHTPVNSHDASICKPHGFEWTADEGIVIEVRFYSDSIHLEAFELYRAHRRGSAYKATLYRQLMDADPGYYDREVARMLEVLRIKLRTEAERRAVA